MRTTPPPIGTGSLLAAMQQLSPANHAMLRYLSGMVKPMTIAQIAQDQDLHQNSVRESIEALYAAGLIERSKVGSASRGRPAWAYYSIAPKTDAVFGVYVSKFACAISEMFRMKSDNPKSLAYTLGAYWAGELDEIAAAEARGLIRSDTEYQDLPDQEKVFILRSLLSAVGHAAKLNSENCRTLCIGTCPFRDTDGSIDQIVCEIHRGQVSQIVQYLSDNSERAFLRPRVRPGVCELTIEKARRNDKQCR